MHAHCYIFILIFTHDTMKTECIELKVHLLKLSEKKIKTVHYCMRYYVVKMYDVVYKKLIKRIHTQEMWLYLPEHSYHRQWKTIKWRLQECSINTCLSCNVLLIEGHNVPAFYVTSNSWKVNYHLEWTKPELVVTRYFHFHMYILLSKHRTLTTQESFPTLIINFI